MHLPLISWDVYWHLRVRVGSYRLGTVTILLWYSKMTSKKLIFRFEWWWYIPVWQLWTSPFLRWRVWLNFRSNTILTSNPHLALLRKPSQLLNWYIQAGKEINLTSSERANTSSMLCLESAAFCLITSGYVSVQRVSSEDQDNLNDSHYAILRHYNHAQKSSW